MVQNNQLNIATLFLQHELHEFMESRTAAVTFRGMGTTGMIKDMSRMTIGEGRDLAVKTKSPER